MKPIGIDFARVPRAPRTPGLALLGLGAFALALCLAWYAGAREETERLEARIAEAERAAWHSPRRLPGPPREARASDAELRVAHEVVQRMTVPWERLFGDLEQSSRGEIALLALQPDAPSRQLRISGEARHFGALLDYSRRLARSGMLGDVVLLAHEVRTGEPLRPVSFSLQAAWSERP